MDHAIHTSTAPLTEMDVVILGAGLVGVVASLFLARAGINVMVIERQDLTLPHQTTDHPKKDRRTTAISYGSSLILKKVGLWSLLEPYAAPIHSIKVFEADTPSSLVFDRSLLENASNNVPPALGYMVDNHLLRSVFQDALITEQTIHLKTQTEVNTFHVNDTHVDLSLKDDSCRVRARLVIGAEGRHSPSRRHFGIRSSTRDYGQTALVADIAHEMDHQNTAFEVFHSSGPLAFLPMASSIDTTVTSEDGKNLPYKSAIVWSCKEPLDHLPHPEILTKIHTLFPYLGTLQFTSTPAFYPLSYQKTSSLFGKRYVLIGDAAHVMHPVAGQGVNLGWRDAETISQKIIAAFSLGLDIGGATLLKEYALHRKKDQIPLLITTHSLIKLFGIAPKGPLTKLLQLGRSYGLGLVNRSPTLKRWHMKKAMGL